MRTVANRKPMIDGVEIANSKDGASISIELVTPKLAEQWLQQNTSNRRLRPSHVRYLAKLIDSGEFCVISNGIGFSQDGGLVDGQHRLHAIVEAGKAVYIPVARGLHQRSYVHHDVGIKKTVSDRLRVDGHYGSVLSYLHLLKGSSSSEGRTQATPSELENIGSVIEGEYAKLHHHGTEYFAKAAIRSAAVIQMLQNPRQAAKIAEMYNELGKGRGVNAITSAWVSAFVRGATKADTHNPDLTFCRAMIAFDPENAEKTRITPTDAQRERIMAEARAFLRESM